MDQMGAFPWLLEKDQPRLAQAADRNHCNMWLKAQDHPGFIHLSKPTYDVILDLIACLLTWSVVTLVRLVCSRTQSLWDFLAPGSCSLGKDLSWKLNWFSYNHLLEPIVVAHEMMACFGYICQFSTTVTKQLRWLTCGEERFVVPPEFAAFCYQLPSCFASVVR